MLSVEAPAKFVLTLQSVPPFLVESILTLALVVLLAVPLIARVQLLLDNTSKGLTTGVRNRENLDRTKRKDQTNPTVVMHYPTSLKLNTSSISDMNFGFTSVRTICSTPTIKPGVSDFDKENVKENLNNQQQQQQQQQERNVLRELIPKEEKMCLPLECSSPFVATNQQLPIVDISTFDYDSYRHKLIEASLMRQYGDRQAPGNVVLNSIHLNSIGSQTGIQLSEKYSHRLFDFIEEYYEATNTIDRQEKEYLHPLDHFLVKSNVRPEMVDQETETKESVLELDQVPDLIDFREQSTVSRSASPAPFSRYRLREEVKHTSKLTEQNSRKSSPIPKTSSRTTPTSNLSITKTRNSLVNPGSQEAFERLENLESVENRTSSGLAVSVENTEKRSSRSRTPRGKESSTISQLNKTLKSSKVPEAIRRRVSSIERGNSDSESLTPGTTKHSEYSEVHSTDEKESATCASVSSSDVGSCYSSSSRPREQSTIRSRASSLCSRSRTIGSPSQTGQWHVDGNRKSSFDSNYLETQKQSLKKSGKPKSTVRPRSTGGRFAWDVPDIPGHNWSTETTADTEKEKTEIAVIAERPKTANLLLNKSRAPEKDEISDTVLTVLESVIDLQDKFPCDDFDRFDIDTNLNREKSIQRSPLLTRRELRRPARSKDRKISSESFVKSPSKDRTSQIGRLSKKLQDKKSNELMDPAGTSAIIEKSSSEVKPSITNRPGSISRLPIHVAKIKKCLQDTNRSLPTDSKGKFFKKSQDHLEKSATNITGISRRPRTAGCVQPQTSSPRPKIELSLEVLQPNDVTPTSALITEVMNEPESQIPFQKESAKRTTSDVNQAKTSSKTSTLRCKKIAPPSRTSINKISKPSTPRLSENDTDTSKKNCHQDNAGKRPFLRARSGKYGAPKINVIDKTRKDSTKETISSNNPVENNEENEEKEVFKLPAEGSKAALVMRRELKTYIKKIKDILANRDKTLQAKDIASLSITASIIPELSSVLSPREINELQTLLHRVEKQEITISREQLEAPTRFK